MYLLYTQFKIVVRKREKQSRKDIVKLWKEDEDKMNYCEWAQRKQSYEGHNTRVAYSLPEMGIPFDYCFSLVKLVGVCTCVTGYNKC